MCGRVLPVRNHEEDSYGYRGPVLTQVEDDVEGQCHYRIHGSARMILNTKHGQLWIDVSDEGVNVFVYKDGGFHEYMFMAGEFG